ncbi:MAG: hypothetical protein RMJ66_05840, partial [Bacteroidia bacterium]|nr:hypothetical protein [Bacteroidia bacterium]
AKIPRNLILSTTSELTTILSISPFGALETRIGGGWQTPNAPWTEQLYPSVNFPFFHRYYTDMVCMPPYQSAGNWTFQGVITWLPQGFLIRQLPLLRRTGWQENLTGRLLYTASEGWHGEISFYLTHFHLRLRRTSIFRPLSFGIHTGIVGPYRRGALTLAVGNPDPRSLRLKPGTP